MPPIRQQEPQRPVAQLKNSAYRDGVEYFSSGSESELCSDDDESEEDADCESQEESDKRQEEELEEGEIFDSDNGSEKTSSLFDESDTEESELNAIVETTQSEVISRLPMDNYIDSVAELMGRLANSEKEVAKKDTIIAELELELKEMEDAHISRVRISLIRDRMARDRRLKEELGKASGKSGALNERLEIQSWIILALQQKRSSEIKKGLEMARNILDNALPEKKMRKEGKLENAKIKALEVMIPNITDKRSEESVISFQLPLNVPNVDDKMASNMAEKNGAVFDSIDSHNGLLTKEPLEFMHVTVVLFC